MLPVVAVTLCCDDDYDDDDCGSSGSSGRCVYVVAFAFVVYFMRK